MSIVVLPELCPGQLGEAAIVDRAAGLGVGDGEQLAGLVDELEPREAAGAERRDLQLDAALDLCDQRARYRDRLLAAVGRQYGEQASRVTQRIGISVRASGRANCPSHSGWA